MIVLNWPMKKQQCSVIGNKETNMKTNTTERQIFGYVVTFEVKEEVLGVFDASNDVVTDFTEASIHAAKEDAEYQIPDDWKDCVEAISNSELDESILESIPVGQIKKLFIATRQATTFYMSQI